MVYRGQEINASSVPIVILEANAPPIIVNPEHFGEDGAGKIYTMAIRLKTQRVSDKRQLSNQLPQLILLLSQGFVSNIAEIEHVEPQPDAWLATMLNEGTNPWLIVIPIVFVICLGAVAAIFIQRHRRLQNAFSRFANSHYDTKTGATRIGGADMEDVDDHHEITPRFTDDEPLVLT